MTTWTPNKGPDGLWRSEKHISWPYSHENPTVRVPRPDGSYTSHSVTRCKTERATFEACRSIRDHLGIALWGERRWWQILQVRTRSVAKHRKVRTGPMTGVSLDDRPGRPRAWVANWYELQLDGSRKKRSQAFSFGTPRTRYATSDEAMQAAIKKRQAMEAKWYSVLGEGSNRHANR